MKKYLFRLTIPSVQEFISQARKTHDLWAGSQIYSDLVKYAAKNLFEDEYKGELIFPVSNAKQFTNLFLGEIETDNPQDIGENIESRIKEKFFEMAEETVKKAIDINNLPKGFEEQINSVLDIKWAFVEYKDNYKEAYEEIVKVIGAIKNIRNFEQFRYQELDGKIIYGEKGRKCSVDGIRNVKFYRLSDSEQDNDRLYDKKLFMSRDEVEVFNELNPRYLQAGEGLSAVSFFKRCYKNSKYEETFPSTARIALMHNDLKFLNKIENYFELFQRDKFITRISKDLKKFNIKEEYCLSSKFYDYMDYYFLYEENLNGKNIPEDCQRRALIKYHKQFLKDLDYLKYYAIIIADGDSMGKWLSGKYLKENKSLYKFHKVLSKALNEFSENAFSWMKEPWGKLVYSGGDDFLAFINLEYIFEVLEKLYIEFEKINYKLNDFIEASERLTISAGVAIAHYKTPLNIVIDKAREMEKLAKENDGKNSFAIAVLRRSGEINQGVWKWKKNEKFIFKPFKKLLKKLKSDNISGTFIKNIQKEFEHLMDKQGNIIVKPEILIKEFDRLFARAKNKNMKDNDFINLRKEVDLLLPERREKEFNLKNFFNTLDIVDFLYRKTY